MKQHPVVEPTVFGFLEGVFGTAVVVTFAFSMGSMVLDATTGMEPKLRLLVTTTATATSFAAAWRFVPEMGPKSTLDEDFDKLTKRFVKTDRLDQLPDEYDDYENSDGDEEEQ